MNVTHVRKVLGGLEPGPFSPRLQLLALYTLSHRVSTVKLPKFWGTGKAQVTLRIGDVTNMSLCD